MNRNTMTGWGWSGSAALLLLSSGTAEANPPALVEIEFISPAILASPELLNSIRDRDAADSFASEPLDCICSDAEQAIGTLSDPEGTLAIEALGCDCAGCRTIVRRLVDQGDLVLPQ